MQKASEAVALTLKEMSAFAKPGMTTKELDNYGGQILNDMGAKSAPYLTYGFPGWTCISINNEFCHGVPSDKRILAEGKDAIDREVDRILPAMKKRGGYFPTCDHGVPAEVSFENYVYFRKRMLEYAD
jgi:methionyl aminopeptidase